MPSGADPTVQQALHLVVRGRVQGVGFRESMRGVAARLGLDGWVRNRLDGSLEALVRGRERDVEAFVTWARHGPPGAQVDGLERRSALAEEQAGLQPGFYRLPTA